MKKKLKSIYLLVSSLLMGILHLPFAFAIPKAFGTITRSVKTISPPEDSVSKKTGEPGSIFAPVKSVYDRLHLQIAGLSQQAFDYAKKGLDVLIKEGRLLNDSIISIADFSLPSSQKRLFIIDLKNYKILFNTLVAHGRNTGRELATSFSNLNSSYKSSPGFYITGDTYLGKNGYSLKLEGVEQGINDNALERGIVVHGAGYVSQEFVNSQGYIGRSQGCPAIPEQLVFPVINAIKNGTCLFIYHPSYISRSLLLP